MTPNSNGFENKGGLYGPCSLSGIGLSENKASHAALFLPYGPSRPERIGNFQQ